MWGLFFAIQHLFLIKFLHFTNAALKMQLATFFASKGQTIDGVMRFFHFPAFKHKLHESNMALKDATFLWLKAAHPTLVAHAVFVRDCCPQNFFS